MPKFAGSVGYATQATETSAGVWTEGMTERSLKGDVLRASKTQDTDNEVNDGITLGNRISLVADQYAFNNFHAIRYVQWMGARWKVTNIEVQPPRLILTLGGVWNGRIPDGDTTEEASH